MAKTSLIGLTLPVQGTLSGQWGDTVNNAISQIVDVAVAGTQTITVDTDIDLTVTEGTYASTGLTANSSQYAVLLCTGARTAARNINTPKQSKTYVVINDTSGGFVGCFTSGDTITATCSRTQRQQCLPILFCHGFSVADEHYVLQSIFDYIYMCFVYIRVIV